MAPMLTEVRPLACVFRSFRQAISLESGRRFRCKAAPSCEGFRCPPRRIAADEVILSCRVPGFTESNYSSLITILMCLLFAPLGVGIVDKCCWPSDHEAVRFGQIRSAPEALKTAVGAADELQWTVIRVMP